MLFFVITEPAFAGNFWSNKYIEGMKAGTRACKGKLIEVNDTDEIRPGGKRTTIILNGRTQEWISSQIDEAIKKGLHPVLLGFSNDALRRNISGVSFDFYSIYTQWCEHMHKNGWDNMALLGVSPENTGDIVKCAAFEDYNSTHNNGNKSKVYYIEESLQKCCEEFLAESNAYNAVLCTNDVVSITLMRMLRQQEGNPGLHIHAFWDSPLAKYLAPEMKTISLNYQELGRQAIKICSFLENNPEISSLFSTIRGAESLEMQDNLPPTSKGQSNFMQDRRARDIYSLEQLFSSLDDIDMQIIGGIVEGIPYEQIAENEIISVGTVKYRVKKMLSVAQKASRDELVELIGEYLSTEIFLKAIQEAKKV